MSFNDAVQEQLARDRSSTLIVDNFHAYARIEGQVQQLWDALRLIGESKLSKDNLLAIYAGIVAMTQHAVESLNITASEQIGFDPRDEEIALLKEELNRLKLQTQGFF